MTSQSNINLPSIQVLLSNIDRQQEAQKLSALQVYPYGATYATPNAPIYPERYNALNIPCKTTMPQYQPYVAVNGYSSPIIAPAANMDSIRSAQILKSLSVQPQAVPRYSQSIMHVASYTPMYNQIPTPLSHKCSPVSYFEQPRQNIDTIKNEYDNDIARIGPSSPSALSTCSLSSLSDSKIPKKCSCKKGSGSAGHIPRPRNAFILFRQHLHYSIFPKDRYMLVTQGSFKTNSEVSREIGKRWRQLPEKEKKYWQDLAQKEKEMHKLKYPDYKYAPRKLMDSQDSNSDSDETSTHHARQRRRQREPCAYCKSKKGLKN